MDNFEKASRSKLRFDTSKGQLSSEDLWDLSLNSLDELAQKVNRLLKDEDVQSFIPTKSKKTTDNTLRLDILKHVIGTKVEEQELRKAKADKAATIARLKELAATKANEQLASQSLDDIMKQIKELEEQVV